MFLGNWDWMAIGNLIWDHRQVYSRFSKKAGFGLTIEAKISCSTGGGGLTNSFILGG